MPAKTPPDPVKPSEAPTGLTDTALDFARAALAPNTLRTYRAQWHLWTTYAHAANASALPADPETVANWLAHRAARVAPSVARVAVASDRRHDGASVATLRTALAAIRFAHLAAGQSFDARHPALQLVLRGIARTTTSAPRQAAPLGPDLLLSILATLGNSPRDVRDGAILALGYCFGCRRSELTGLDLEEIGEGTGALRLGPTRLEIRLWHAKTRHARADAETMVVPRGPNRAAVAAIVRWIRLADVQRGEPVLRRVLKAEGISPNRLDPQSVSLIIKDRVREHLLAQGAPESVAAKVARGYSGHSLRVGLAVAAAEAGASVLAIQSALGHRSPAMAARYASAAEKSRMSPHFLPGVSLGRKRTKGQIGKGSGQ
ncbi:MAG: tyrosine-type recombinase/integrase [Hyphomicrobium sp.]|nr:tyrosine-type recombinase/integrase [Hyphomicrobium sp.]